MNVRVGVLRAIDLDDPVDGREIHSSRRDISAEQYRMFLLNELEVDCCALVLILLSVEFEQVLVDLEGFEGLVGEADLLAR